MESQRVVVVVEDAAAARAALQWAVGNFIRGGDSITLLHVCPPARSRRKRRRLRLGGFQLALAFKDLCNGIAEVRGSRRRNSIGWVGWSWSVVGQRLATERNQSAGVTPPLRRQISCRVAVCLVVDA
jgi:nucleotide-binding universal stress UspA family protein